MVPISIKVLLEEFPLCPHIDYRYNSDKVVDETTEIIAEHIPNDCIKHRLSQNILRNPLNRVEDE